MAPMNKNPLEKLEERFPVGAMLVCMVDLSRIEIVAHFERELAGSGGAHRGRYRQPIRLSRGIGWFCFMQRRSRNLLLRMPE